MKLQIKEIKTSHEHYPFVEELMQAAFPQQERRNNDEQRSHTDNHPLFHCNLILDGDAPVGLITYWDFIRFRYIEHFAIDGKLRNQGYGKKALECLKAMSATPLILEAEEPMDETTRRRIAFYQRQGFTLHDIPYLQPPYRKGDLWLPLVLMSYGEIALEERLDEIKQTIYRNVYQVEI